MSRLAKIASALTKLAYEHDPNILKEHEQAARDKLKQLDAENNDTTLLQQTYMEKLKEFINKPVTPEDVSSVLHVFDEEKKEPENA